MKGTVVKRTISLGLLLIGFISLSACTPIYKFQTSEPKAKILAMGFGDVTFCKDGSIYTPPALALNRKIKFIPAEERITVIKNLSFSGYNVTHYCNPRLSFIPKSGETYIINADLNGNQCFIEVVKSNGEKETGVDIETTVDKPNCYAK